jgi:hypothetical protein
LLTPWPPHANEQKVKARDASHERKIQKRRAGASAQKTKKIERKTQYRNPILSQTYAFLALALGVEAKT